MLAKNVLLNYIVFFIEKNQKDVNDTLCRKFTLKIKCWHFLTTSQWMDSQSTVFSFEYAGFGPKILLFRSQPACFAKIKYSLTIFKIKFYAAWKGHDFKKSNWFSSKSSNNISKFSESQLIDYLTMLLSNIFFPLFSSDLAKRNCLRW